MRHNQFDLDDQLDELNDMSVGALPPIRNAPKRKKDSKKPKKLASKSSPSALADQMDDRSSLNFTYKAGRLEAGWLLDSLGAFFEQQWFDDVLRLVKGGKEASVYQCQGNATTKTAYIAAKVYRPRHFRNLRNDHLYREGRDRLDADGITIIDDRMHKAMNQRTTFGRELMHTSWLQHEYQAMERLYAAGADVPRPYTRASNAILMEYIGGPGMAAPTLSQVHLDRAEARRLFASVVRNIDLMLSHHVIHGDLSAYNILYWEGKITIIDFPQTIAPDRNRNAYKIFERDITRVCEYFAEQNIPVNARGLTKKLWERYESPYLPEVDPAYLDDQDEEDLAFWADYLEKIRR